MLPVLQTLLVRASGGRRIGRLMAVVTLPALIGPIFGPVIGGVVVGHLSWRWIFFVNLPIVLLAIALAWRVLPAGAPKGGGRLDWPGLLLLLSPGLAGLVYGLVQAGERGGFGHAAVLPPLVIGVLLAPQGLGSLLARAAGGLADRIGPRPVVLGGIVLTALGTAPFVLAGQHTGDPLLALALVVRGAGLSSVNMAVMVGAYQGVPREQIPDASSTTRIMQQLGGSFGAAILATVLQQQLAAHAGAAGHAVAFDHAFAWALALTALAAVPALLLPRLPRRHSSEPAARNPATERAPGRA
jgi:MFS family permease